MRAQHSHNARAEQLRPEKKQEKERRPNLNSVPTGPSNDVKYYQVPINTGSSTLIFSYPKIHAVRTYFARYV